MDSAIHWINLYPGYNANGLISVEISCLQTILILWIGIYPVHSAIQLFNNWGNREIRLSKERDEGQKKHVALPRSILYGYFYWSINELPNKRVERNSQIFFNLIIVAIIRL